MKPKITSTASFWMSSRLCSILTLTTFVILVAPNSNPGLHATDDNDSQVELKTPAAFCPICSNSNVPESAEGIDAPILHLAPFGRSHDATKITFEKLTNLDYVGTPYYSIRNLSLYECQGWCRDEVDCVAASFSFVVNPLAPIQETTCVLHNDTQARKPSANPQKAINMYYLVKTNVRTEKVCNRLWAFERFPNKMLRGYDNVAIFSSNRENCMAACLNERRFVCRAAEFNSITFQCHMSDTDRRTTPVEDFIDAPGVDYFENACLDVDQVCSGVRMYDIAKLGPAQDVITHYVDLNYYPDKELLVSSKSECLRACTMDRDFLCRSVLFKPTEALGQNSCSLYHVDHVMFPDGAQIFKSMSSQLPLLDTGETVGFYMEANCANQSDTLTKLSSVTKRPSTTTSKIEQRSTTKQPSLTKDGYDDGACDSYGVCYDVSIQCTDQKIVVDVKTSRPFHGRIYAMGRSETCNTAVKNGQNFKLDLPLTGQECNTQSLGGVYTNTVVLQHHNVVLTKADKVYNVRCTYETSSKNISFGMMPVSDIDMRDPDNGLAQQITASPEAPVPRIMIFGVDGKEATTVRIGDKLTFKIEIPGNTPYGIFARSCVAMAKDARSTFEIIDDRGCPVDPAIFPRFRQVDSALESNYEAFRFTESYGVIFQCNVKYCIGKCEPVDCGAGKPSWGRRRRSIEDKEEMTLSQEIVVLDLQDDPPPSPSSQTQHREKVLIENRLLEDGQCASRTSLYVLAITTSAMLISYVATVAYFLSQRRLNSKHYS